MWLKYKILIFISFFIYSDGAIPKLKFHNFNKENENKLMFSDLNFRLPNNTIPIHYDIYLITDIHIPNFDFFGTVTIDIRAVEDSSTITIHYRQMTIVNIDLYSSGNELIESGVNFEQTGVTEFLIIKPTSQLIENNEYKVKINYRGILRTDDYGFYRTSYINEEGRRVWLATTQFQATDARHAFPCYDEPQIRSTYDIRIRHHQNYMALSNMPVASIIRSPVRGYLITQFQRIPSMQTYLVAFTISDYIYVENSAVVPPQRIYAKRESINNNETDLAMFVSPKIMLECEKYFGINYTFPKMDQIAITYFDAGAMENWGLVSYREIFLLFDPLIRTTRNREFIIAIIAHEFAHQWIGNIVCPEWWTYLWINEGFATLYEYYMPHFAFPHERFDDLFLVDVMHRVFEVDADPNIRHMSLYVEDPISIDYLFDWISYHKAGSVLHTFMYALGENVFQKGTTNFILDRYENYANSNHLYAAIQQAVDEYYGADTLDVAELMRTWEFQAGFPLLTVTRDDDDNIFLHQERFFYNRNTQSDNIWAIPINYATKSNPNFTSTQFDIWMTTRDEILTKQTGSKTWDFGDWIIFNIQQNFYYRVNYDIKSWNLIIDQLNAENQGYEEIHLRNRAQLIDDAFNIAYSSRLSYDVVFGLMSHLWQETDYIPWVAAYRSSLYLNRWISGSVAYENYQKFIRHNTYKIFNKLGVVFIDDEVQVDRYARSIIVNMACEAQLDECLQQTTQELTDFIENDKRIAPEYVSLIYCNGMRIANAAIFLKMQNKLFKSSDTAERNRIINGLGCTQSVDLLASYLNLAILPGIQLATNEKIRILTQPASNGETSLKVLLRFTSVMYDPISKISNNAMITVLRNIAMYIGSNELLNDFNSLVANLLVTGFINQFEFIELINAAVLNLNWQTTNLEDVTNFFENWQPQNVQ